MRRYGFITSTIFLPFVLNLSLWPSAETQDNRGGTDQTRWVVISLANASGRR